MLYRANRRAGWENEIYNRKRITHTHRARGHVCFPWTNSLFCMHSDMCLAHFSTVKFTFWAHSRTSKLRETPLFLSLWEAHQAKCMQTCVPLGHGCDSGHYDILMHSSHSLHIAQSHLFCTFTVWKNWMMLFGLAPQKQITLHM